MFNIIDTEISSFIEKLRNSGYKIPGYNHNSYENFTPGVTAIYYSGPYFNDKEIIASIRTMLTGKWMSSGGNVTEFEKKFSEHVNQHFSCMTNSGSSANLAVIAGLKSYFNWQKDDEIIVSVVGFPTTVSVIVQNGLKPVFIDIEEETLNFDIEKIEKKITDKTRAIFLSPVLGNPPDINKLIGICKKYKLFLILDGCDSLGTKWENKNIQEYAVASSCSFYASHEICTFEGGMVSSNNRFILDKVRKIVNWGRDCTCKGTENLLPNGSCNHRFDKWLKNYDGIIDHKYVFSEMGYNLKPLDVCGAVGIEQLKKLEMICFLRNKTKEIISDFFLKYIDGIRLPKQLKSAQTTWFGTPVICKDKKQKDALVAYLERNRIQTRNYFSGNILLHPGYEQLDDYKKYPVANIVYDKVFFMGANPAYTDEVIKYIKYVIKGFNQSYHGK